MTTKYPVKVGDTLYPARTPLRRASLEEMRFCWPGISEKPDGEFVGVWFPNRELPTLLKLDQVVT